MTEDITSIMLDPSGLLAANLAKEAAYAIKRDLDAFLLGLRAGIQAIGGTQVINNSSTGTIGGTEVSNPFDINAILAARLALDNLFVPPQDRVWIVSPTQYTQLLALDKVTSMFYRTSAPLENGVVGTLFGTPVYMSNMIQANSATTYINGYTAGSPNYIPQPGVTGTGQLYYPTQDTATSLPVTWGTANNSGAAAQAVHTAIYMNREAFSLAMLMEPKTEYSRETLYLADAVVTSTLYGARIYRPTNAVIVHTNAVIPSADV